MTYKYYPFAVLIMYLAFLHIFILLFGMTLVSHDAISSHTILKMLFILLPGTLVYTFLYFSVFFECLTVDDNGLEQRTFFKKIYIPWNSISRIQYKPKDGYNDHEKIYQYAISLFVFFVITVFTFYLSIKFKLRKWTSTTCIQLPAGIKCDLLKLEFKEGGGFGL